MKFDREKNLKKSMEYFASGKFDDALELAQEILKYYPKDLQAMTFISIIKEVIGKKKESDALLGKVLEIDPNYPEAIYFSGIKAGKKGDYKKAAQLIQKAIDYQSKDAKKELSEYYQNLGSALWRLNLRFDAFKAWEKSLELNPEQKMAKEYLEKFSNEYGQPTAPTKAFDDFYAFQAMKIKEYLNKDNKNKFGDLDEANNVIKKIIDRWRIINKEVNLSELSTDEKIKIFKETEINF
ncbi:MAG: tetratricopeptide repeat protein [Candidatus Helarchaeota archaeon]|nr:tetratricopeptide repeat protein [Candidatus Helarchaeota archaeon]